jgi:hypothetical protein
MGLEVKTNKLDVELKLRNAVFDRLQSLAALHPRRETKGFRCVLYLSAPIDRSSPLSPRVEDDVLNDRFGILCRNY